MRLLLLAFLSACMAHAADDLAALKATAFELRQIDPETVGPGHVPPALNVFKRQLVAYVESRLSLPDTSAEDINRSLREAGLLGEPGGLNERVGNTGEIEIIQPPDPIRSVVVLTSVALPCGYDSSMYVYFHGTGGMRRVLTIEQDVTTREYEPWGIRYRLSDPAPDGSRLLLAHGYPPQCMSRFTRTYYRLVRLNPSGIAPRVLLEERRDTVLSAELGGVDLRPDGFLFEVAQTGDFSFREYAVPLQYEVKGDQIRRVAPYALQAHDFVLEWLRGKWAEVSAWMVKPMTEAGHRAVAEELRLPHIEFSQLCSDKSRWQVKMGRLDSDTERYFLVEEKQPLQFRLLDMSSTRQPGCPGETPPPSDNPSLFPRRR